MNTDERRRQSSGTSSDRTAPKGGKMPAAHPQSVFIRGDPFPSVFSKQPSLPPKPTPTRNVMPHFNVTARSAKFEMCERGGA
jgi:hypothetical protein